MNHDDQLVDRPVHMRGATELCHDCGGDGADIPIRANINNNPQQEEE